MNMICGICGAPIHRQGYTTNTRTGISYHNFCPNKDEPMTSPEPNPSKSGNETELQSARMNLDADDIAYIERMGAKDDAQRQPLPGAPEVVEAMARAIYLKSHRPVVEWEDTDRAERHQWFEMARAAYAAMKALEP